MKKVLVAEDESSIREFVVINLKRNGYDVVEAADGAQAIEKYKACNGDIDVAILDIMMPYVDGLEVCKQLRAMNANLGIIMLTAKTQEMDKVSGLLIGADDYVTKPCSPSVLMKRVAALLRRRDGNRNNAKVLSLGDLKLDSFAHEVWLGGKSISLTLKEYSILQKLLAAPGRVFTREQMLDDIWGFDFDGDIRTIDSHVARLRTKLGEWGSQHIKTIYGTGYKLEVSKDGAQKDENA